MHNSAFTPLGPTFFVDSTAPVFIGRPVLNISCTSYRIRNLTAASGYISWMPRNATNTTPATFTSAAPTANTPATNTIGFPSSAVGEAIGTFSLPSECWFIASAGTFEITPGEGR